MPVAVSAVSYPGVYIEEIPSGVRTIAGVSTSVTAFVGSAKRGPINRAVRCLSFSDFERRFGGLAADSEMSYAVRQFFLNGGSEAWAVRLAKNPVAANKPLNTGESPAKLALTLTALEEGAAGNEIRVRVDYATSNPGSTFNLVIAYAPKDNPAGAIFETHQNLSMNSKDPRFVESILEADSRLVSAKRAELPVNFSAKGTSRSGSLSGDLTKLIDDNHNTLRISLDGAEPISVILDKVTTNGIEALEAALRVALANKLPGVEVSSDVTSEGQRLVLTSKTGGESSSVRVLPGLTKDVASRLRLGPLFGGLEEDAVAVLRPAETPPHAAVTSGTIEDLTDVGTTLRLVLDGYQDAISIEPGALSGDNLSAKLDDVAARIQKAVCARKPSNPGFAGFTVARSDNNKLLLQSGTRGEGSSLQIMATEGDDLAASLHLLADADTSAAKATDVTLEGGTEEGYEPEDAYSLFIADRSKRQGIYALEAVDLFNLLVLPGVTDPGILMDSAAYCTERRAFLIADSPIAGDQQDAVAQMEEAVTGTKLPKTDYAAVYFPWTKVADPLNGGRPRKVPPSGTVAGLYARTDSARGVWKAPAGTEATLVGVQELGYKLTDGENGTLNPLGVNCLRLFPVYGAVAWGSRTLRGADQMTSEYKYIPVRRLALFLEESLYRGLKWVVFEPNDEPLWAQIRLNVGAFMHNLFQQGAFQGTTPRDAYFVKCDKETTTQNDINLGIVNIVVGFAPLKPAEFVIIKIQQMAGQIQT